MDFHVIVRTILYPIGRHFSNEANKRGIPDKIAEKIGLNDSAEFENSPIFRELRKIGSALQTLGTILFLVLILAILYWLKN